MAKALLALLAVYAMKNMRRSGSEPAKPGGTITAGNPGGGLGAPGGGGGLGDLLKGPLGGILGGTLGGAAAGTILNGGLGDLLKQLQDSGQGDVAKSWVGTGPNKAISQHDLANALDITLTADRRDRMARRLARRADPALPRLVDQLTPDGRLPPTKEAAR